MATKCPKCQTENAEASLFCSVCGTKLDAAKEFSLLQTETLQAPIKELTTGSTFAGRYQIIEELGKGGMGRVYKVFDTEIKEKIALKLLKAEIGIDEEMIERFRNEIKTARMIAHRNVCRMFDLGEEKGAYFITMEYVPGEDMKSFLKRAAPLSFGRAISIGKQICEGLAEAHRLGVVHRDLKPGNIMIDKEGSARIMDFGIARSIAEKGITGTGVMIGTPEYMSPEQAEGKEADQRSDIYSLGVILFEMVTGRVPFEGDTPLSVAVKQKTEAPRNPRTINPQVPEDLSRAILRCLEKEEEKRYQTAEEVLADLGNIEKGIPPAERIIPKKERLTSKEITVKLRLRKLFIPTLVFLALIAAGIVVWRALPSKKAPPLPFVASRPTLAVLYFENKSGEAKLDNWRDGLAELLITSLSQSKYVRVISGEEMFAILKRLGLADARKYSSEDIEKIATETQATHILRGSFIKAGESFVITAGLQKLGANESPTTLRLEARNENEIIAKVDEVARQAKEGLGFTTAQIEGDIETEAGKVTTPSPEALKYYIESRKHLFNMDYEKAIAFLEKAVEIDREFAMAYRAMAAAHANLGHVAELQKYYKKAVELSGRLPENERLLIEAIWFGIEDNPARSIEVLQRLVTIYPEHMLGHFWLAYYYHANGDLDKAIERQEFVVRNENSAINVSSLAHFYREKGLYERAEDVCQSFLRGGEDNFSVREQLSLSYLCRGLFGSALAEAEEAFLIKPSTKESIGNILLLRGDIAGAEKAYQQVFKVIPARGRGCLYRLALTRGKYDEGITLMQRNLKESKDSKENEARGCRELSVALEKAGRYDEAYKAFGQYMRLSDEYRESASESALFYRQWQKIRDIFSKGRIQAEMRLFDEAQRTAAELKALIDSGKKEKELMWYEYILGLIEFEKKNNLKAADFLERACARLDFEADWNEDHALFLDRLARALYEAGYLDKARNEFEKIGLLTTGRLSYGDVYVKTFYFLGKIAEKQGDKVRARENYQKFLALWKDANPGIPEVDDARKRLAALNQ